MSQDILMPALSPTMEEGALARWHVKPGDTVRAGDVIAEIETDKATMEVEAVDEGTIEALLVEAGAQNVKVGAPIARLSGDGPASFETPAAPAPQDDGPIVPADGPAPPKAQANDQTQQARHPEEGASAPVSKDANPPPSPSVRRIAAENHLDLSAVRGTGREGRITKGDALAASHPDRTFASPIARRLAKEQNLDLGSIKGSGPDGRIIERDLAGAKSAPPPAAAQQPTAPAAHPAPTLEQMGIPPGSYDLVPLDGMRRTVARRLTEAARDIPHFPLTIDVEIDALLQSRTEINALLEKEGVKISVNDMIIKACAMALKHEPNANASFTADGIALHHHADIAMAVAIDGGLITPIIFQAETKSLAQIATEAKDLATRARERKLKPQEYLGGTFSVSNLGMFGIRQFSSIINPPQGCILSVGVGEKRPVVRGDQLAVATLMTVTLTCDHRVVDGATGAKWLQAFRMMIEKPATMLA